MNDTYVFLSILARWRKIYNCISFKLLSKSLIGQTDMSCVKEQWLLISDGLRHISVRICVDSIRGGWLQHIQNFSWWLILVCCHNEGPPNQWVLQSAFLCNQNIDAPCSRNAKVHCRCYKTNIDFFHTSWTANKPVRANNTHHFKIDQQVSEKVSRRKHAKITQHSRASLDLSLSLSRARSSTHPAAKCPRSARTTCPGRSSSPRSGRSGTSGTAPINMDA